MRGKGEGSVFKDARGLWTAIVELPPRNNKRRRKVIRSKSKAVVMTKLRSLQNELAQSGDLPTKDQTIEQWMREWFTHIALPKIRPKTAQTYRGLIEREILPTIGKTKLDKLTPADVRHVHAETMKKGLSSTTSAQVHRILVVALKYAVREGRVARNAAALTDAPQKASTNLSALTVEESLKVLEAATHDRLGSLWAAVLLTGARQGELLGLELDRVTDRLDLSWQLQRIQWEHGDQLINQHDQKGKQLHACLRARAAECPTRKIVVPASFEHRQIKGGLYWTRPKSDAGWRIIPLVDPLKSILATRMVVVAGEPNPHGLVWTREDGSPIDPRYESEQWDLLLKRAGVTDVRLHDGRHTTVDLLTLAHVPDDLIQQIVGHSSRAQTQAYKSRGDIQRLTQAMAQLSEFIQPGDARSGKPAELAS
ncbi:MAG TPA: site-specific integrase [Galbitalea sp.]